MHNLEKILPARLRDLRKGKSQAETARLCGIPQSSYTRYEAGTITPKGDALCKIASIYGLTIEELFDGKKEAFTKTRLTETPSTFDTMRIYTDNADALLQHSIEDLQDENKALKMRVDMLEEAFKLIPKGTPHAK